MFGKLYNWVNSRTGVQESLEEALYENIPGGSKWRYVSGSMLVFAFMTQAITGIFLWMNYSAGSQNAWASVYYITYNMIMVACSTSDGTTLHSGLRFPFTL